MRVSETRRRAPGTITLLGASLLILVPATVLMLATSLSAQTPPALPSPTVIAGLTNVGTVYYVDNGL